MKTNHELIVRWCARECHRQRSGELSVWHMYRAWEVASRWRTPAITNGRIRTLAVLIEPVKNLDGYRKCDVRVGYDVKLDWALVPVAMNDLLRAQTTMPPVEFFRHFEEVHPFVDGNGRTGSILYNYLMGNLADPEDAPWLWDSPDPMHILRYEY